MLIYLLPNLFALLSNMITFIFIDLKIMQRTMKGNLITNLAFRQFVHEAIIISFYLRLREMQWRRELCPLGDAQVLPLSELLLESQQLLGREGRSGLSVWLVLPQVALNLSWLAILWKKKKEHALSRSACCAREQRRALCSYEQTDGQISREGVPRDR